MAYRKGPRRLSAEEKALWDRVIGKATRLSSTPTIVPDPTLKVPAFPPPEKQMPFQIGERSRPTPPHHDLVPSLSRRIAQQPISMDHKAFTRMKRGKLPVEGRIDLHGMTLDQAYPRLMQFIQSARGSGKRLVLVITGKGRRGTDAGSIPVRQGILKHQVPIWLRSSALGVHVLQIAEAHQSHGGSGAYYVYLRRGR